jgi:hypothetical protein
MDHSRAHDVSADMPAAHDDDDNSEPGVARIVRGMLLAILASGLRFAGLAAIGGGVFGFATGLNVARDLLILKIMGFGFCLGAALVVVRLLAYGAERLFRRTPDDW